MPWLLERLYTHQQLPTARFAFQGTVNWMRALALLVGAGLFKSDALRDKYSRTEKRTPNEEADTLAFSYLLMALHNASSLAKHTELDEPYSCVRSGIVSWYYSIYYASKAMIAAATGADPQTHADTAKVFQSDLVDRNLIVNPFQYSIKNLTTANVDLVVTNLRGTNPFDLNTLPTNATEALGAVLSYLKGTAEYRQEEIEERLKESTQFKDLGVVNFRTKDARALRDGKLSPAYVNFLVEAFRYRGKANYRDAIYLSYGADYTPALTQFSQDLDTVARAFLNMSSHYIARRVARGNWKSFTEDIIANSHFGLPIDLSVV